MTKKNNSEKKPQIKKFEDIKVGEEVEFIVKVTESDINNFADLVGDYNPIHVDEIFARKQFGGRIAHGMLVASHFSTLIGMYLPGQNALYLSQECRFLKPVKINEIIKIRGVVISKSATVNILTIKTQVLNQYNELLVDGKASVMVLEKSEEEKPSYKEEVKMDISNKVALVTGSSRGIGASTAVLLAKNNASVIINYNKSKEDADKVVKLIKSFNGKAKAIKADVTNQSEVHQMIDIAKDTFGSIDILVNNASLNVLSKAFVHTTWDDFQRDIDVIIKGAFNCTQAVLKDMIEKKYGKIINIITTATIGTPPTQWCEYVTAKSGLIGFSKALAAELGPMGIRVNMVFPGLTETSLTAHLPPRFKDVVAHQTPLKRIAKPDDIAKVILFLASEASDYLTGVSIPVCGGNVMY